jgi:hypothetical protein
MTRRMKTAGSGDRSVLKSMLRLKEGGKVDGDVFAMRK